MRRSEFWLIVSGSALITIDDKTSEYEAGKSVRIPVKSKHRVENKYEKLLVFIEIQTGDYFGEDDIIRINDDYGRI
jgi:mannose-6-phosphate isomerase